MDDVIADHIVKTPGTCGGKPRIAGSRIKVAMIAERHEREGISVAQILEDFPHITAAGVYAALAYYHDHRAEIDAEIREDADFIEKLMAETPSILETRINDAQD